MVQFKSNDAVLAWMKQNPGAAKAILDTYNRTLKDINKNSANTAMVKMLEKTLAAQIEAGRKLIRVIKQGQNTLSARIASSKVGGSRNATPNWVTPVATCSSPGSPNSLN